MGDLGMASTSRPFSDEEKRLGKEGEDVVRTWLLREGYTVLPVSFIQMVDKGAPVLLDQSLKRAYDAILPDVMVWKNGPPKWVEIKSKSNFTLHENPPRRIEHGVKLRHIGAYDYVAQKTRSSVTLAILELSGSMVYMATLDQIKASMRLYPMQNEWHAFMPRDMFECHSLADMALPKPVEPLAERTREQIRIVPGNKYSNSSASK
jgi:hypothetical protein